MDKKAIFIKDIKPGKGSWDPINEFNSLSDNGSLWNARLPENVDNMLRFYVKGALFTGHVFISNESKTKRKIFLCSKRGRVVNFFEIKASDLKEYLKKIL